MSAPDGPALILEGAPATAPAARSRTGYLQPLAHYTEIFERSVRLLKGWMADGRDADPPRMPPFDAPADMLSWWHAVKSNRPPDVLIRLAAAGHRHTTAPPDPAPPTSLPSAATPSASPAAAPLFEAGAQASAPGASSTPAPAVDAAAEGSGLAMALIGGASIGFSASLHRIRVAEASKGELHRRIVADALATTDVDLRARLQAEAARAYREWTEASDQLRKAEKEAPAILAAAGRAWDSEAVLSSLEAFHLVQRSSFAGLWRRVRPMMRACATEVEEDAVWLRELDRVFATWSAEQFAAKIAATA